MKKKIALVLVLCITTAMLCGCSKVSYEDASSEIRIDFSNGYFIPIKEWGTDMDSYYQQLVYANDSKVMYYIIKTSKGIGITPLYNADGTLQIYEGE